MAVETHHLQYITGIMQLYRLIMVVRSFHSIFELRISLLIVKVNLSYHQALQRDCYLKGLII